ncbi:Transcription factor Tfb2 [Leishmania braziliensis]|nr:Transcription factor Tfb2 [Leishmania braziliensis]
MSSSSSVLDVPFIEVICSHPAREVLCAECPALLLLIYEHVVAELQAGRRAVDVFRGTSRQDHLSELLAMSSFSELFQRLYPPSQSCGADDGAASTYFWRQVRVTLEAAWSQPCDAKARALLTQVHGQPRFHFCGPRDAVVPGEGYPLHPVSLERALATSKRFLRTATTCALDGSADALGGRQPELCAVLQLARLVPHVPLTGVAPKKEVTPEGISFCMVSLQQRWWVLVNAALERVLLLTRASVNSSSNTSGSSRVTKPLLWQLLAVLSVLDTAHYIFAFPERQQDFAAHLLLARLAEVGLVYPVLRDDRRCFVVSPDFLHAIHWHANAPLSFTFNHYLVRSGSGFNDSRVSAIRREDTDTIITETNFRLYAYTEDSDLLNILHQFAELEEVVNGNLHCYRVTRDSFAAAMRKGITATQVLRFLSLRAHPSMLRRYGEKEENGDTKSPSPAGDAPSSTFSAPPRRAAVAGTRGSTTFIDAVTTLVVPHSFCDQLRMWERECRRVVFEHHVVLLRNVSTEQQKAVTAYLADAGEVDAIVHTERGYMVIREEVFDRLIAPLLE